MLWIPATCELEAHLSALPRAGALVMLTPAGEAYAKRYFNDHWREDSDAVGVGDLNFNTTGAPRRRCWLAGATTPEIAEALTSTVDQAQRVIDAYRARRGVLAANAIARL